MPCRLGSTVRSFFLGYWIPPSDPNPGRPWNVFGDVVYAENTANVGYTSAFYGVDGTGPLDPLPSGNFSSGGVYRHWCRWPAAGQASGCVLSAAACSAFAVLASQSTPAEWAALSLSPRPPFLQAAPPRPP